MGEKMRIAVVCDSVNMLGGSSISAKRFMHGLKTRGHELMLITNSVSEKEFSDPLLEGIRIEVSDSFPLIKNEKFAFSNIGFHRLDKLFLDFKPDIIYSIYPTSFSGYRSVHAARRLGIPIIGHFHVQIENLSTKLETLKLVDTVYKMFLPLYNMYDRILCPSVFAESILKNYKIKVPTDVLSNGVDLKRFRKMGESETNYIYDKFSIKKDKFNLLYIGRLDREKDLMTLMNAFKLLSNEKKDMQLVIGGIGSDHDLIKIFIEENKLGDSARLLGRIPDEDIVALYNIGDVFVSPSLCELEGMTLLEAMACGLPLIVSDSSLSAAKYLVNENGLTFEAKNPIALVAAIKKLHEDKSLSQKYSEKSLENASSYDFEKSVEKLEGIFRSCV